MKEAAVRRRGLDVHRLVLVAFIVGLGVVQFFLNPFQRVLVAEIMVWCIFALSYDVLLGYTGLMSLGHALFFGVGAYGVILSTLSFGFPVLPALAVAVAVTAALSVGLGYVAARLTGVYFAIVTLIFGVVFFLTAQNWRWLTGGDDGLSFELAPVGISGAKFSLYDPVASYYFILVFLAVSWLLLTRMMNSPVGKALEAIRENEDRARLLGYNVQRYKLFAFTAAGVFAGLAGGLHAVLFRFASSQLFFVSNSINPLVWTLAGGAGTLVGPVVGTIVLMLTLDYLSSLFPYYLIILGIILIITIRIAPRGLVGSIIHRWRATRVSR
ncbi:MAG: branched-chain amino acid ABC transporter permease [Candidatus Bathyarchaeia archaeon]